MKSADIVLRDCAPPDLERIQVIYANAVLNGVASFEIQPPSLEEMHSRRETVIRGGYPYIVAVLGDQVIGYAYAGAYRPRPAYRSSVENSVYIDKAYQRRGIGRRLLEELIRQCEARGFRQMVAVIGDSGNTASIQMHRELGFTDVGVLRSVGWKHGRWLDSVIMQRPLGSGDGDAPLVE